MKIDFNNETDCGGMAVFGTQTITINPKLLLDDCIISPKQKLEQIEEQFVKEFSYVMTHETFHLLLKPFQLVSEFNEEKAIGRILNEKLGKCEVII